MAFASAPSPGSPPPSGEDRRYTHFPLALGVMTSIFFMWGFITCLNDILIPHLKAIFDLNYAEEMLVQIASFTGYLVFAIPSGKLVGWIGYKRTRVTGLLVMAVGLILFVPAASLPAFPFFLTALIIVA